MNTKATFLAIFAILVLILGQVEVTKAAVKCNPMQLSSCAVAITTTKPPSKLCCTKLQEQRPCLCAYLKNPNLQKFIKSPRAKSVAITCRAQIPRCKH